MIFSRFHLAEEACVRLLNISTGCLFKRPQGYFLKATRPCAVAYGCARIRRLVCLDPGVYRFPATAIQWSGLVARGVFSKVHEFCQAGSFLPLLDGGCAQGASARR